METTASKPTNSTKTGASSSDHRSSVRITTPVAWVYCSSSLQISKRKTDSLGVRLLSSLGDALLLPASRLAVWHLGCRLLFFILVLVLAARVLAGRDPES